MRNTIIFSGLILLLQCCSSGRLIQVEMVNQVNEKQPVPVETCVVNAGADEFVQCAPSGFEQVVDDAPVILVPSVPSINPSDLHKISIPEKENESIPPQPKKMENVLKEAHDARVISIVGIVLLFTGFGSIAGLVLSIIALTKSKKAIDIINNSTIKYTNEKEAYQAKNIAITGLIIFGLLIIIAISLAYLLIVLFGL